MTRTLNAALLLLAVTFAVGCGNRGAKPAPEAKKPETENSGEGIFKKKTQEIGKYDPNGAFQVISDQKIHATDPIFAPMQAYGPMVEQISTMSIKPAIAAFELENNHFPTYEEFMERIIKANNIWLPVLPFKGKYMYDEAKHELIVVRHPDDVEKMESLSK